MSTLSLQDVVLMEQVIKICQGRGAILPQEMVPIGQLYERLVKILQEEKDRQDALKKKEEEKKEEKKE